jgi:hypothetical protein
VYQLRRAHDPPLVAPLGDVLRDLVHQLITPFF